MNQPCLWDRCFPFLILMGQNTNEIDSFDKISVCGGGAEDLLSHDCCVSVHYLVHQGLCKTDSFVVVTLRL